MRTRQAVTRLGAAVLVAGGALGLTGSPAYAADSPDLSVTVTGTTIAAGAPEKVFEVTVTNGGPGTATGVEVVFDLSDLDRNVVDFVAPTDEDGKPVCDESGNNVTCGVVDIPEGQRLDLGATLERKGGPGAAGVITVVVLHDGAGAGENVYVADVAVGGEGPDLYAYAPDVPFNPTTNRTEGTVAAGATTNLYFAVGNQGDTAVGGVELTVDLPEHVTFAKTFDGCDYVNGNASVTCKIDDLPLIPAKDDTDAEDDIFSALLFTWPVRVAADAPAPATLAEGQVKVQPIAASAEPENARLKSAALPEGVEGAKAPLDVDETDNTDEFAVYVGAGGSGGEDGAGGGAGGGELPITGVQVGVIGGVGLAVVVAGVALLLLSRRRRVVLVTPKDESPTV